MSETARETARGRTRETSRRGSPLRPLTATALAAVLVALPATATATEPAGEPGTEPGASLTLTSVPDDPESTWTSAVTVTLECDPVGGTHPWAEDACEALTEAKGNFEDIERISNMCLPYWDPVTITATGHWHGREISFQDWHSNNDCAAMFTGGVFGFRGPAPTG
ncbi:SSI family serine proteinase inhibitor [Streptomyces sp. TRM 70361]|uniref:SSI family serine proteinase inhibitor n=1 Tax=Streptomyces sp. TRM 70361 TaxID=3116553 RepID=UPI002E7C4A76|nr:SSI family serine proteinase inhibitor [Streptomyces sp. TRM 70361]MEE1942440.1 SSI family serine proteinase inhibitor [Streptomyces sp. TRM 70361]